MEPTNHRVVLQFNDCDFRHRKALEVLQKQKRHKTDLVVNAIIHYISCPNAEQEFTTEFLRKTVREVIEEMAADGSLGIQSKGASDSSPSAEDTDTLGGLMSAFR